MNNHDMIEGIEACKLRVWARIKYQITQNDNDLSRLGKMLIKESDKIERGRKATIRTHQR